MFALLSAAARVYASVLNNVKGDAETIRFRSIAGDVISATCIVSASGRNIERLMDGMMIDATNREYVVVFTDSTETVPALESVFQWKGKSLTLFDVQDYNGQHIGYATGHG